MMMMKEKRNLDPWIEIKVAVAPSFSLRQPFRAGTWQKDGCEKSGRNFPCIRREAWPRARLDYWLFWFSIGHEGLAQGYSTCRFPGPDRREAKPRSLVTYLAWNSRHSKF